MGPFGHGHTHRQAYSRVRIYFQITSKLFWQIRGKDLQRLDPPTIVLFVLAASLMFTYHVLCAIYVFFLRYEQQFICYIGSVEFKAQSSEIRSVSNFPTIESFLFRTFSQFDLSRTYISSHRELRGQSSR